MNGRAIPGAYLFRLYVCDKEMSWPHHIGETHQPNWVVYVPDSEKFRLTNVIPERIIFVSRGITVLWLVYLVSEAGYSVITHSWCSTAESPSPNLELESVASQEGIVRADCITAGRHNLEVHQGYKVCSCRTDSCRLHSFDNSTDIVPSRPWWTFNLNMATDGPFRSNLKPERLAGKQLSSNCC